MVEGDKVVYGGGLHRWVYGSSHSENASTGARSDLYFRTAPIYGVRSKGAGNRGFLEYRAKEGDSRRGWGST